MKFDYSFWFGVILLLALLSGKLRRRYAERAQLAKEAEDRRLKLSELEAGDSVIIHLAYANPSICCVPVLSNDPENERILLYLKWKNSPYEKKVFDYSDEIFNDFNLLNSGIVNPEERQNKEKDNEMDSVKLLAILQADLKAALELEDYKRADAIQKDIDKLMKKNV